MRKLMRAVVATFCLIALSAQGQTLLVNFESLPGADGVLHTVDDEAMVMPDGHTLLTLDEQFASTGIHFTTGTLLQDAFYDGNPDNFFLSSSLPDVHFDMPVFGITLASHSYWTAALTAFDRAGNVLAIDRIFNPAHEPLHDTFSVTSVVPIYRFAITTETVPFSTPIMNLDNMVLTLSPVPEPSQFAFLSAGLMLIAGRVFRRR